jgi:hypothetical protein
MRLPICHLPMVLACALGACSSGGSNQDAGTGNDATLGDDATPGNDANATLTCAWLAGGNCWKTTAAMATGCLPPETESGVLSADNATCTYASGIRVTFTPPVVLPTPDVVTWNFTVTGANGQSCLHFEHTSTRDFTLVVAGQTVYETTTDGVDLTVACPGGVTYRAPTALDLLSCDPEFDGLPGIAWSSTGTSLSVSLAGAAGGSLALFDCRKN